MYSRSGERNSTNEQTHWLIISTSSDNDIKHLDPRPDFSWPGIDVDGFGTSSINSQLCRPMYVELMAKEGYPYSSEYKVVG